MSMRNESKRRNLRGPHSASPYRGVSPYASGRQSGKTERKRLAQPTAGLSNYLKDTLKGVEDGVVLKRSPPKKPASTKKHIESTLDPEQLTHDIFLLKKEILAHQMKDKMNLTKISSLEKDLKKAYSTIRQYESSQNQHGPNEKKGDTLLVSGLKTELHKSRKETEKVKAELTRVKESIKNTDLEQAQLEVSVFYEETQRLTALLEQKEISQGSTTTGASPGIETIRKLQETNRILQADNIDLKEELETALNSESQLRANLDALGAKGGGSSKYDNLTRQGLLQELEKMENMCIVLKKELETVSKQSKEKNDALDASLKAAGLSSLDDIDKLRKKLKSRGHQDSGKQEMGSLEPRLKEGFSSVDNIDELRETLLSQGSNKSQKKWDKESIQTSTLSHPDINRSPKPRSRNKSDEHTAEMAVTQLQNVLRGYRARLRLVKEMQERPVFLDKQVDHLELASEHEERRKGVQHSDKEFKPSPIAHVLPKTEPQKPKTPVSTTVSASNPKGNIVHNIPSDFRLSSSLGMRFSDEEVSNKDNDGGHQRKEDSFESDSESNTDIEEDVQAETFSDDDF
eukprot:m.38822 g.38822  ORF g.38822 m.38822 type:complete len:572 (+) comp9476_c0_seq2:404-2119(+)